MGLLFEALDTRCAENKVLIKTTRYDAGPRARAMRYTVDEAVAHIEQSRRILEWEKKVLVRFRNEGLNNIPSANHFFYDRSLTLDPAYEGKFGQYNIPSKYLSNEPFLVMEYIEGEILEDAMKRPEFRARLDENLMGLARELLTIFIRMHREKDFGPNTGYFIYQDLKPANILVSHHDYFTLIDFGGVTLRLGGKTTDPTAGCITPGYAAPEAEGREAYIDSRFDLYTLGATLWHAVTQKDPRDLGEFPRLDPGQLKGIRPETARVIVRALSSNPDARYPSAAEMRKDVIAALRAARG